MRKIKDYAVTAVVVTFILWLNVTLDGPDCNYLGASDCVEHQYITVDLSND